MEFKRIGRVTVCEETIEYLKGQIISGKLSPGEQLPSEETFAEKLGVGRGTIREALKVLLYLGFIERKGNCTFVANRDGTTGSVDGISESIAMYRNIMEMIELRKIVEPGAVALAAEKANDEELELLEQEYHFMESATDIEAFITHDNKFHLLIIDCVKNDLLKGIIRNIQERMRDSQGVILRKGHIQVRSTEYHRKILMALKEHDADLARTYMFNHVMDVEKEMYTIIVEGGKA